jgi:hypothetical protein
VILALLIPGMPELPVYPQHYQLKEYTVQDGLPQSQARNLFQDSRGYLWIITRNGLSRFDGYEFRNYFMQDGLPANFVRKVIEDKDGYIYVCSDHGLSKYDGYGFRNCRKDLEYPDEMIFAGLVGDSILIMARDASSTQCRFISFKDGEYRDCAGRLPFYDTMNINKVRYRKPSDDFIIMSDDGNLYRWRGNKIKHYDGIKIRDILPYGDKIILDGGDEFYELKGEEIVPIAHLENGTVRYRGPVTPDLEELINLFNGIRLRDRWSVRFSSFFSDSESNLWLGSEANLYKLMPGAFYALDEKDGLPRDTWTLAEDRDGHMWFGTLGGDLLELTGERLVKRSGFRQLFRTNPAFFKGSLTTSDGDIYFSLNAGVLIWNGKSYSKIPGVMENLQICIIYQDPIDRSVFLGTGRGICRIKDGRVEYYPGPLSGIGAIEGIARDDDGKYWLSGEKGLFLLDGHNVIPFRDDLVSAGNNYDLIKDSRGGIWVTSANGLFFRDKSAPAFRQVTPGGRNQSANSVILMDSAHILVGRMTDICIIDVARFYDGENAYFTLYDRSDGFTGNDCLDNGIVKDRNGRFWILTSSGRVVVFDPKKLKVNRVPPRINITDLEYRTDSMQWKPLRIPGLFYGRQGDILLQNTRNNVKIKFTGISLTNPSRVLYRSRLSGYDERWSEESTDREAVFKNLKPGKYVFQVMAFNSDGIGTDEIRSLSFAVVPGFWQTFAFKAAAVALAVIFIVLLTWWITRMVIRRKNEQIRKRHELSRLQMSSVIKQFDPHFTFNLISSIGSLILSGERAASYSYITKLSKLLRLVIEDGSSLFRPLEDEISFVKGDCDLQQFRFRERLSYTVEIDEKVDLHRLIPKMVIQTFAENSIKHGIENKPEGGTLEISIMESGSSVEIKIRDNGIGRRAAASYSGNNTGSGIRTIKSIFDLTDRNNKSRVTLDVIDLTDSFGNAEGTLVQIIIPHDYVFELD